MMAAVDVLDLGIRNRDRGCAATDRLERESKSARARYSPVPGRRFSVIVASPESFCVFSAKLIFWPSPSIRGPGLMLVRRSTFGSNLIFMGAVYNSLTFSSMTWTVTGVLSCTVAVAALKVSRGSTGRGRFSCLCGRGGGGCGNGSRRQFRSRRCSSVSRSDRYLLRQPSDLHP